MNKQTYLFELRKALSNLPEAEQEDIIRDMEEYFDEALTRGQTVEDITKKLGSPKQMADTIYAEAKVKKISTATTVPQKVSAMWGAFIAILLLTPFNLIFVLLPLLLITLFFIIGWPIVVALAFTLPVVLIAVIIIGFDIGFKIFALLCLLFFAIGWGGMILAAIIVMLYLTIYFFRGMAKLFQWNINFIKNRMRGH